MTILTRLQLYDQVWAEPMRTLAQRFGMSDVGLKKHCVRLGVPTPERGYWAKLAAGKRVIRTPLPPRDPGVSDAVSIGRDPYSWRGDASAQLAQPEPEPPVFEESLASVRARVVRRVGKVRSHRDLTSPAATLRKLIEDDARRVERKRTESWFWDDPAFESGFEKRRLRLLNSLALGLTKAGARLEARGKPARELSVRVGDTSLSVGFDHPQAKPNRHGEWVVREGPADTLQLTIGGKAPSAGYRAVWSEGPDAKLEARLTEMVIEIIVAGEVEHRAYRMRHHQWTLERREELCQSKISAWVMCGF